MNPSINPAREAHRTSYHLAHSFLSDGDSGCILWEVAYGRVLEREVAVRAGNHPLVLGGNLSGPC